MAKKNFTTQEDKKEIPLTAPNQTTPFYLKYPMLILSALVILLYMSSINFGFTELDDIIFVHELHDYNSNLSNLAHSFKRGVFNDTADTYYRPLLLNSFIVNNIISDVNVKGYHAFNVIFHLISVLLLFLLLQRLRINRAHSFFLTCLFAVHPVLSQAVAWIPGRNDTLLAMFCFAYMIFSLNTMRNGNIRDLILQFVFLLAALFTKETGLMAIPAFLILAACMTEISWKDKKNYLVYGTWILATLIWLGIRAMATLKHDKVILSDVVSNFIPRLSLSIQYLGKIVLPFNLSVFPMLRETSYLWGILSVLIIAAFIYFAKEKKSKVIIGSVVWFFFFLLPLFVLPSALNDQDFEHRLYLPIVGILILIGHSWLFQYFEEKKLAMIILGICILFFGINILHQQKFKNALSFWNAAVESTPKSSYATMMLAARLHEEDSLRGVQLMHHAYELNPKERYVNYYLGKQCLNENKTDSAEKYLLAELGTSKYFDTYFLLSRVYFVKKDTLQSLNYMEKYLELDPVNSQAINNYVLMLTQAGQWQKAKEFIDKKVASGISVPRALIDLVNKPQS